MGVGTIIVIVIVVVVRLVPQQPEMPSPPLPKEEKPRVVPPEKPPAVPPEKPPVVLPEKPQEKPPVVLPEKPPEKPPVVRSIVISDEEVIPLLPVKGARLHFLPDNKVQVGHRSLPRLLQPKIDLGVSAGMMWFSGIPSWLDLSRADKKIYNYCSWWRPDWKWSFIIDKSAAIWGITTWDGIHTADTAPTFYWNTLAGESGVKYNLEIDTGSDFSAPLVAKGKISGLSYTLSGKEALAEGTYYWRVTEEGKLWIVDMPPWLDISKYDPEVTQLPTVVSVKTGEGKVDISYIP